MSQVDVLLTVGKLDASLALLTTEDHHVIEFPTVLLPDDVKAGSIVKLSVSQTLEEEKKQRDLFREIQAKILEKYGSHKPKPPVLKIVNVTQTSCVLAWDPLELGSSSLKSLVLYRQGVRSTVIPCPLKANTTKISGLSVDTDYEFELKLTTTSGQLWSDKVKMHTHKMTDMSGITVCLGPLDPLLNISGAQIAQSLAQIGARPLQGRVAIDTTHFVTNDIENDDDPELIKAKNSNIPIVRPEWVRASEIEKRIVGVRGFYLDADQAILKSYQFPPASDEFKAKFAKLKAGETTENLNLEKKLPEIDGSKSSVKDTRDAEEVQITENDLKEAAEQPVDEAREERVFEESEGEKSQSREMTDSEARKGAPKSSDDSSEQQGTVAPAPTTEEPPVEPESISESAEEKNSGEAQQSNNDNARIVSDTVAVDSEAKAKVTDPEQPAAEPTETGANALAEAKAVDQAPEESNAVTEVAIEEGIESNAAAEPVTGTSKEAETEALKEAETEAPNKAVTEGEAVPEAPEEEPVEVALSEETTAESEAPKEPVAEAEVSQEETAETAAPKKAATEAETPKEASAEPEAPKEETAETESSIEAASEAAAGSEPSETTHGEDEDSNGALEQPTSTENAPSETAAKSPATPSATRSNKKNKKKKGKKK